MSIRDKAEAEARIRSLVDRLQHQLDLGWLEVQVVFDEQGKKGEDVCGSHCDWQYRRIVMAWCLPEAALLDDDELELVAAHELCHALIECLWDSHPDKENPLVTKVGELATENVARVVIHLLKNNLR